jgi:alpha-1,2-mannosyltransferase
VPTLDRIRRLPTGWIAGAAVLVWAVSVAVTVRFGSHWHLDLRVYRDAGHALYHGGSPFSDFFTVSHLPFTYPPFALLVVSPLSLGRLGPVEAFWWLLSALCLVVTVELVLTTATSITGRRAWAVAAALGGFATLALEPVRSNFDYGQINVLLMVMVVADLTRVRPPWRGVLVGLAAAVKLTPLMYLVYFVVAKEWRSLARGVATFALATGGAWLILPHDSALYWFHEATDAARTGQLGIVSNQSWNGMVHRSPFDGGHLGTAVWLVLSLATIACGVALARRMVVRSRPAEAIVVLALTELLVSPVSWTHHWSWLVIVPIVVVTVWPVHRSVAIALLVLFGLGVTAPYLWLDRQPVSFLVGNALVLAAAVVMVLWMAAEFGTRKVSAASGGAGGAPVRASETRAG